MTNIQNDMNFADLLGCLCCNRKDDIHKTSLKSGTFHQAIYQVATFEKKYAYVETKFFLVSSRFLCLAIFSILLLYFEIFFYFLEN